MATKADIPESVSLLEKEGANSCLTQPEFNQPTEIDNYLCQTGKEMQENEKPKKKDENFGAAEETGTKENEVAVEVEEMAERGERKKEIKDVAGTILYVVNEEPYQEVGDGKALGQEGKFEHAEVIKIGQGLVEAKETGDSKQDEEEGKKMDTSDAPETSKEVSNLETGCGETTEALIHTPVQTAKLFDSASRAETMLIEESTGESSIGIQDKASESCFRFLELEKGDVCEIKPIERTHTKKESPAYDKIEESSSEVAVSLNQYDKEVKCGNEDKVDMATVGNKLVQMSVVACNEEHQEATNLSEHGVDRIPVTGETQEKGNVDATLIIQPQEICQEKVDNSEIFKVVSDTGLDDIIQSPQECGQTGTLNKTEEVNSNEYGEGKKEENPEQKLGCLFVKNEEHKQCIGEGQALILESARENRDEFKHTPILAGDISDAVTVASPACSKEEMSIREESLVQQDEAENENIERSRKIVSEETESTASIERGETSMSAKQDIPIKSQEDCFEEKEKEEESMEADVISDTGIPKEKNLPPIASDEKVQNVESEIQNKNTDDWQTNTIHSLEQERTLIEGEKLEKASAFEHREQVHEANGMSREEENHTENDLEAHERTVNTILEHSSAEGEATTELIPEVGETDIENVQGIHKLDSEENLEVKDAEAKIAEDTHAKKEACDPKIQALATSSDDTERSEDEVTSNKVCSSPFVNNTAKQSFQSVSVQVATTKSQAEVEDNYKTINNLNEEITGIGEVTGEQNIKANVTNASSGAINEETVESLEEIIHKEKILQGEDIEEQINKDNNAKGISRDPVEEGQTKDFQNAEKITEQLSREIFEDSKTAKTADNAAKETDQNDETSILKEQENLQSENLTPVETSATEEKDEDACSTINEYNKNNRGVTGATGNCEKENSKGEEDLEQISQKNESEEKLERSIDVPAENEERASSKMAYFQEEETLEDPQVEAKEAEAEKEDAEEQIIDESNILSLESVEQGPAENFQNDEKIAEKSDRDIFEESLTAETSENMAHETDQNDERPKTTLLSSLVKEGEFPQDEDKGTTLSEASGKEQKEAVGSLVEGVDDTNGNTELGDANGNGKQEEPKKVGSIVDDANQDDSTLQALLVIEQGSLQIDNIIPAAEQDGRGPSIKKDEESENNFELSEVKEEQLKSEENLEWTLQRKEAGEKIEQSITLISAQNRVAASRVVESPQGNGMEGVIQEGEESKAHVIQDCNIKSLSEESFETVPDKNDQNNEENAERSGKKIFDKVDGASEMIEDGKDHNDKSQNPDVPAPLMKGVIQEEGENIIPTEALPKDIKEDGESLVKSGESSTELLEANDQSKKEAPEVDEDQKQELQKKELGEFLEQPTNAMAEETETGAWTEKAYHITSPKDADAIQNFEEAVAILKKEGNRDIDLTKLKNVATEKDLEPVEDAYVNKVEDELVSESLTCETDAEVLEKTLTLESMEELQSKDIKKEMEEEIKNDVKEVPEGTKIACSSEDTHRHITIEEHSGTDISAQSTGEETASIYKDVVEEKPKKEMHEELGITGIDEDTEKQVAVEENIMEDQLAEHKTITSGDEHTEKQIPMEEIVKQELSTEATKQEVQEDIQTADEVEDIGKQGSEIEDNIVVTTRETNEEDPLKKEKEDEVETTGLKEVKDSNSEFTEPVEARGPVKERGSELKNNEETNKDLSPRKEFEEESPQNEVKESLAEIPTLESESKEETIETEKDIYDSNFVPTTEVTKEAKFEEGESEEKTEQKLEAEDHFNETQKEEKSIIGVILAEEVHKDDEKAGADEIVKHAKEEDNDIKALHIASAGAESVHKVEESSSIFTVLLKALDCHKQSEIAVSEAQGAPATEKEVSFSNTMEKEVGGNIAVSGDAGTSKTLKIRELVDQEESCKSRTSEDEESSNVGDKTLKYIESISADREYSIPEEDESTKKSEDILMEVVAEQKATAELEVGNQNEELEATDTKNNEILTEQECASGIVARDESHETIAATNPRELEENTNDIQNQSSQSVAQNQESQERMHKPQEKAELKLEPEDHAKETENEDETIKAINLTEEVLEDAEKATGDGETVKHDSEQENGIKELRTASTEDESGLKVEESSPISTDKVKASHSDEQTETVNSEVEEALAVGKEISITEATEEEQVQDESSEKPTGFSSVEAAEESEEIIKKEIMEEADSSYDEIKETTTEKTSTEEAQKDNKPGQTSNATKDDRILDTVKVEASQQNKVAESIAVEGNSPNSAFQAPSEDDENVIQEGIHAGVNREKNYEASKTASVSQDIEAVIGNEACADQMVIEDTTKGEKLESSPAPIPPKEEEYETKEEIQNKEESTKEEDIIKDELPENSSGFYTTEETCLPKEDHRESDFPQLGFDSPNEEYEKKAILDENKEEKEASETAIKTDRQSLEDENDDQTFQEDKKQEYVSSTSIGMREQNINEVELMSDEVKTTEGVCIQKDETSEFDTSREFDTSQLDLGCNKYTKDESVEETEEEKEAPESISKISLEATEAVKEITLLQTIAMQRSGDQNKTPSSELLSKEQEHGPTVAKEEIASDQTSLKEKLEEQTEAPSEQEPGTSTTYESIEKSAREVEEMQDETETAEEVTLDKDTPRELEYSQLESQLNNDILNESPQQVQREWKAPEGTKEEIEEVAGSASDHDSKDFELTKEDEIASDKTLMIEEKPEEQNRTPSAALISGTTTTSKNTEEQVKEVENIDPCLPKEEAKELKVPGLALEKDSAQEVPREEEEIPDEAFKLQPQDDGNTIKDAECLLESQKITDLEVHTHQDTNELEETEVKEKHLMAAITDLVEEDNGSKKTFDATEMTRSEVANEEIADKNKEAEEKPPVILDGKKTTESSQEVELTVKDTVGDNATEKEIQNREIHKEAKKAEESKTTANEIAEEKIANHRHQAGVENETINEKFADKAEEAAIELDPENQNDETFVGQGSRTEAITVAEQEFSTEIPDIKEAAAETKITFEETVPIAKLEEQKQIPSAALLYKRGDSATSTTSVNIEETTEKVEVIEDEPKTTEKMSFQKEEPRKLGITESERPLDTDVQKESPQEVQEEVHAHVETKEGKKEAYESESLSKFDSQGFEATKEDEITSGEALVVEEKSEEQSQTSSAALVSETPTLLQKIEEHVKDVEIPSDDNPQISYTPNELEVRELELGKESKEEEETPDEILKSESMENKIEIKDSECSLEREKITEMAGLPERTSDLKSKISDETSVSKISEEASVSESEIHRYEIKEKQTGEAIIIDGTKMTCNEIRNEEIAEDKEDTKNTTPITIGEVRIEECHQEPELKAEKSLDEKVILKEIQTKQLHGTSYQEFDNKVPDAEETVTESKITFYQTPSVAKSQGQNQIESTVLLSKEEANGTKATSKSIDETATEAQEMEDKPKTTEEAPLQKEVLRELQVSELETPVDKRVQVSRKEVREGEGQTIDEHKQEIKEAPESEAASKTDTGETLMTEEKLEKQIQAPSASLFPETTKRSEKIEEPARELETPGNQESQISAAPMPKEMEVSGLALDKNSKQEQEIPDEALKMEAEENENKVNGAECPPKCEKNTEMAGLSEKTSNLKTDTSEQTFAYDSEIHGYEVISKGAETEMKEKIGGVETPCQTTVDATEVINNRDKNEVAPETKEEATKEYEAAKETANAASEIEKSRDEEDLGNTESNKNESSKLSLLDMMQRSTKRHDMEQTGEKEAEKAKSEEEREEKGAIEEEGDDHKKNDSSGSDAPVIIEASRDIDTRISHKKSHNILSGVGSRVKHSISRVKKVITGGSGKSSHAKQQHSPK